MQTEYIRTEAVPKNALTATLFYLAERKMILLKQINGEHWRIRGLVEKVNGSNWIPSAARSVWRSG